MNKKKIINDPVYGFVTIPGELIFDIIEDPVFQRLRRIKQLGLTDFVYPGALHTRFHHAIGAMHLMGKTIAALRSKGHEISNEELQAAQIAILLHDVGHGPFSHALEKSILNNVSHELISIALIEHLNIKFSGALDLTLQMFTNQYKRGFFYQLISSQLDIDRLDYLQRDCFFTGVYEGAIGVDRIIQMLEIKNDSIVVEEKGIYSIENFLNARRFMYWQVYLHKTTVSTELMLIQIIKRAKELIREGVNVFATPALQVFLNHEISIGHFKNDPFYLESFTKLDDFDIWASVKMWMQHSDKTLSSLCGMLLERKLFKIIISSEIPEKSTLINIENKLADELHLSPEEYKYFILTGSISNAAYVSGGNSINVLTKKGEILDISEASDLPNIKAMSKIVKKYYVSWHKGVSV